MRILVQLVKEASVSIEGKEISRIGRGFLLLVGLAPGDDLPLAKKMAEKVVKLRVFPDENGKTNRSLSDIGGNILSVSQFTLYGSAKEGNRPAFVGAMKPEEARELYAGFFEYLKSLHPEAKNGVFQADMQVSLINDGPFTLLLDSKELFGR